LNRPSCPRRFPEMAPAPRRTIGASSRREDSAGFSLLGVLTVVVLMGALAVMALAAAGSFDATSPTVRPIQPTAGTGIPAVSSAARAACALSAREIESAALAYYAGHEGQWPPDIATLTEGTPPLLKSGPDPRWGLVYDGANGTVDASSCGRL
jgi:hypothetical protein